MDQIPSFDQWYARNHNGDSFEKRWMRGGQSKTRTLAALTVFLRNYVSEMAQKACGVAALDTSPARPETPVQGQTNRGAA